MSLYDDLRNAVSGNANGPTAEETRALISAMNAQQNNARNQLYSNAQNSNPYINANIGAGTFGGYGQFPPPTNPFGRKHEGVLSSHPSELPAMVMPLSTLIDMWRVKFGDVWIDENSPVTPPVEDYPFWHTAARRLHSNGAFEYVDNWFRLKEGV